LELRVIKKKKGRFVSVDERRDGRLKDVNDEEI
jgi:hypothetical protein